jgi:hypothetical protein
MGASARRDLSPLHKDIAAYLAFAALTLALTFPLIIHLGDRVPADARDPMYALWLETWEWRAAAAPAHFADGNIFYPHHGATFYGDPVPALALFGAPVRLAGGSPVAAYNFVFFLSFLVGACGMYALAKRLTGSRGAAFVAGLIFAFFPYNFAHLGHIELLFYGWMPFCFLFVHRYFDAPALRNALGIAFFFLLQALSCAYYAEYMAFFLALTAAYFAVRTGALKRPAFWRDAGVAAVLTAAVLGPYFAAMLRVHERLRFVRPLWEIQLYSAEAQHYFAVPPINRVWGWLLGGLGAQEWQLFPGLVPVVLALLWLFGRKRLATGSVSVPSPAAARLPWFFRAWDAVNAVWSLFVVYLAIWGGRGVNVAGIWMSTRTLRDPLGLLLVSLLLRLLLAGPTRHRWAAAWRGLTPPEKTYALITAAAWLLSLGPEIRILGRGIIGGPYAFFFDWVPGFRNVRVPARFSVMAMLGLSMLGAWGLQRLASRRGSAKAAFWVPGLTAALVVIEAVSVPIPLSPIPQGNAVPAVYADVARLPEGAALVELPMPARDADEADEAPAVYFSSLHRHPIVNGYSGNAPPGYRVIREAMERFPSEATLALLRDLGVDYVLIHGRGYRAPKGEEMFGQLAAFGVLVEPVADKDGDHLIRLNLSPAAAAPAGEVLRPVGDRKAWSAMASLNPKDAHFAFDGDPATGWSTGYPQRAGDSFEIDFGESLEFRKIDLRMGTNPLDFPRDFVVEASADGRTWSRIFERKGFFPAVDKRTIEDVLNYAVPIPVEPTTARRVRITLTGSHPERHWSIAEILMLK